MVTELKTHTLILAALPAVSYLIAVRATSAYLAYFGVSQELLFVNLWQIALLGSWFFSLAGLFVLAVLFLNLSWFVRAPSLIGAFPWTYHSLILAILFFNIDSWGYWGLILLALNILLDTRQYLKFRARSKKAGVNLTFWEVVEKLTGQNQYLFETSIYELLYKKGLLNAVLFAGCALILSGYIGEFRAFTKRDFLTIELQETDYILVATHGTVGIFSEVRCGGGDCGLAGKLTMRDLSQGGIVLSERNFNKAFVEIDRH